jgi:alpha-beta hydrolase superfamily lysophospholipase
MPLESQFDVGPGGPLYAVSWMPSEAPRAHVVLAHGYAEHCRRYDRVATALNAAGYAVHAYDHRGHGKSPGPRGYVGRFDQLADDLAAFRAHVSPRIGDAPHFLLGHSMGGLVLARHVQRHGAGAARGLIFSSPLLAVGPEVSPMLVKVAALLGRLTPRLPVLALDSAAISRDPTEVRAYDADPLVYHGKIVARTGAQFNEAIQAAQAQLDRLTAPIYAFHGTADRLAPISGSRLLAAGAASTDKTLQEYAGAYHELFNEPEREAVQSALLAWLGARC